jgi:hypothetical protein
MLPFFTNFGREMQFELDTINILPTAAVLTAQELQNVHSQLRRDITFLNLRIAASANKKRIEGPILKKGDKVYL